MATVQRAPLPCAGIVRSERALLLVVGLLTTDGHIRPGERADYTLADQCRIQVVVSDRHVLVDYTDVHQADYNVTVWCLLLGVIVVGVL